MKWQIYPSENGNLKFILMDSYSERSDRSSGRSTLPGKWQFEIHTDRFLIGELRQMKWQIYPSENGNLKFILMDSYSERSDRSSGRSTLPAKWQFEIHTDGFLL